MANYTGTSGDDTQFFGADNDTMLGKNGDDTLGGGGGADKVDGGGGDDVLISGGNDGAVDTLIGGIGNDFLIGWFGDSMQGGAGSDRIAFRLQAITGDVAIDLSDATTGGTNIIKATVDGVDQANTKVNGVESAEVTLGGGDDLVTLGTTLGFVSGGAGDDTILGSTGHDYLRGQAGNDRIEGGDGFDRAGYSEAAVGVKVSLKSQGVLQNTGGSGKDILIGIEALSGSFHNDRLIGDDDVNWLWGLDGEDSLYGFGGDDLLSVGTGDHLLEGGQGSDTLNIWGNGQFETGATVDLSLLGEAQDTGHGLMTLKSIENVSGSIHADELAGNQYNNILYGDAGSDTLNGGGKHDVLYGDAEFDTNDGTGLSGVPKLAYERAGWEPGADGVTYDDMLDGGLGNDTLMGGYGADTLTGGDGQDVFVYRLASDSTPELADLITDLHNRLDTIDLSMVDADETTAGDQAFTLVGSFSGTAGELRLEYDSELGVTHIYGDVDGDGEAELQIDAAGNKSAFDNFVL